MSLIMQSISDGSDNMYLNSEQVIIHAISAYTHSFFVIRDTSDAESNIDSEVLMVVDNLVNRDAEPEDVILADSGILRYLIERAQQEVLSPDWEQELDEL